MRIVIAGGTGFIGQKLADVLIEAGHEVLILTRKEKAPAGKISYVKWLEESASPESQIGNADVFINLAGVSINNGRWNAAHQKQIYDSRMEATDELLRIISVLPKKPSAFINASAIGIYPSSFNAVYTETSLETAKDFLGKTVHDWEERAKQAESYSNRMAFMRFGVVLGNEGGAFPLMSLPYKFFAGGTVGSGKQWVSWVHITDVVRSILFVIEKENIHGPVNATSPSPVRMKDVGKTIGAVLHRPHWLPVPSLMMKLAPGQKSTLVLEGQHVIPEVLTEESFQFMFPSLRLALEDLLTKR